jgi:hypothetical protein
MIKHTRIPWMSKNEYFETTGKEKPIGLLLGGSYA